MLRRLSILPNVYYNYLKDRKKEYKAHINKVLNKIQYYFHLFGGRPGHRMIRIFLKESGIVLSKVTVHKYMNKILKLRSIVFRKKPGYVKGHAHMVFPNLLKGNFKALKPGIIWCTDFTYIRKSDGKLRYNCTILDLFNREVVSSVTDTRITSELAIRTLKKALRLRRSVELILHSDQGSQYTSKEFVEFCKNKKITQSMSKAGCPYDNAVMERYFNTLKNELIYQRSFYDDNELYKQIEDYAYNWYNRRRPHFYNGGIPPKKVKYLA